MSAIETIRFKGDTPARKRLMVPSSFAHPAKGQLGMWALMIERYSKESDLVLDPMAGIGTSLVAALMGRNVICVEIEAHFVEPMRQSWEKMRNMPMLGHQVGQAVILRGDARALPLPDASVGAAITSPPYEAAGWKADENPDNIQQREDKRRLLYPMRPALPGRYTRPVDAIISSPPYAEGLGHDVGRERDIDIAKGLHNARGQASYTHPRPVDAIVTSLPYADNAEGVHGGALMHKLRPRHAELLQQGAENIGNMKGAAYWSAMTQVYAEAWRVLRPGGILALVLKGFTRSGQYQDLPGQTEALLLAAGWVKHDHWRRELWGLSFWRTLQRRRDPAAFDERLKYEEVRAFRKPGADGGALAGVVHGDDGEYPLLRG